MEKTFALDLRALVGAGSSGDPERLFRAIEAELEPVVEHLHRNNPPVDLDRLTWILIELVTNSLTAPLGKILAAKTGLPRQELLDAFGTNVLWPHPSPDRIGRTASSAVRQRLGSSVGCSADQFVRLPLREKFRILGIALDEGWLRVIFRSGEPKGDFEMLVESDYGPSDDDHREILRRFDEYDSERAKIVELRKNHADPEGTYHIPSFTGGGGAGLLMCIRTANELGLDFEYLADEAKLGRTVFRIATSSVHRMSRNTERPTPNSQHSRQGASARSVDPTASPPYAHGRHRRAPEPG